MDVNKIKSDIAVEYVVKSLKKKGYSPKEITRDKSSPDYYGCDIIVNINGKKTKIEVKGSGKKEGIPDCYDTEFDKNLNFNSDLLYIVRLDGKNKPIQLQKLTKKEVDKFSKKHREKRIIVLSSSLKKELFKGNIGETENI